MGAMTSDRLCTAASSTAARLTILLKAVAQSTHLRQMLVQPNRSAAAGTASSTRRTLPSRRQPCNGQGKVAPKPGDHRMALLHPSPDPPPAAAAAVTTRSINPACSISNGSTPGP